MRILAQSVVPARDPYLHLGYLSATTSAPEGPSLLAGVLLIIGGALGMVRRAPSAEVRSFQLTGYALRRSRAARAVGAALVISGLIAIGWSFRRGTRYLYPEAHTEYVVYRLGSELDREPASQDSSPAELSYGGRPDAWGRPLRVTRAADGDRERYVVESAGPDGAFDTEDDIVSSPSER